MILDSAKLECDSGSVADPDDLPYALGLPDPDPDPLDRDTDPDPSINASRTYNFSLHHQRTALSQNIRIPVFFLGYFNDKFENSFLILKYAKPTKPN